MFYDWIKYVDTTNENVMLLIELFEKELKTYNGNMPFWMYIDWLQTIYHSQIPDEPPRTRGGKRKGAGRKRIGITKKVSITLTVDQWSRIEKSGQSTSEYVRMSIK